MYAFTETAVKWLLSKIKTAGARKYSNVQIPVSSWIWDGEKYAASVQIPGVTVQDVPLVTFSEDDTSLFYRTCMAGDGTVTIYTDQIPNRTITLQSIVVV